MKTDSLFVSEIFASIQGEGPNTGTPSIFLRLGICNLQCTWCDTPYTWKKGITDYKEQSIKDVLKKINRLRKGTKISHLVITGGEPLLQQAALKPLLESMGDMTIEFETNGSVMPSESFLKFVKKRNIAFNISPKLKDSGNKSYVVQNYPNAILKFVYVNKKSEKLILDFLKKRDNKNKIYIMPEGTSVEKMKEKLFDVLAFCKKNGFIFTPRLHIHLFGNQRGT